jgi:hypothetical protein
MLPYTHRGRDCEEKDSLPLFDGHTVEVKKVQLLLGQCWTIPTHSLVASASPHNLSENKSKLAAKYWPRSFWSNTTSLPCLRLMISERSLCCISPKAALESALI